MSNKFGVEDILKKKKKEYVLTVFMKATGPIFILPHIVSYQGINSTS